MSLPVESNDSSGTAGIGHEAVRGRHCQAGMLAAPHYTPRKATANGARVKWDSKSGALMCRYVLHAMLNEVLIGMVWVALG